MVCCSQGGGHDVGQVMVGSVGIALVLGAGAGAQNVRDHRLHQGVFSVFGQDGLKNIEQ